MTKIYLEKDEVFGYGKISVSGHSGYADEGSDIICAYVSSSCELIMSILMDELCADVETDINPEKAFVGLVIPATHNNTEKAQVISCCVKGFARQMKEFSKQFPQFVSITIA